MEDDALKVVEALEAAKAKLAELEDIMKNEEIAKQKIYNSQRLIKYFGNQDGKLSLRAIERDSGCSINTVRKHFISWDKI